MDHDPEVLAEQPWKQTLDVLTSDMDPGNIDIKVLADRYRAHINELQERNFSVSARAVRILAALLRMKTMALETVEDDQEKKENPLDFEGELEEGFLEGEIENEGPQIEEGPELEMPVKPRPRRRMQLDELKTALEDAIEVKEKREQRQQERQEIDRQFQMEEQTVENKINSLFSRVKNLVSTDDKVKFSRLVEEETNEERIEKFLHVLHLENDEKVRLFQEEFLGDLHVKPEEEIPN